MTSMPKKLSQRMKRRLSHDSTVLAPRYAEGGKVTWVNCQCDTTAGLAGCPLHGTQYNNRPQTYEIAVFCTNCGLGTEHLYSARPHGRAAGLSKLRVRMPGRPTEGDSMKRKRHFSVGRTVEMISQAQQEILDYLAKQPEGFWNSPTVVERHSAGVYRIRQKPANDLLKK